MLNAKWKTGSRLDGVSPYLRRRRLGGVFHGAENEGFGAGRLRKAGVWAG
ncbi:MAG: hypothetical protein ABSG78_18065 [Verrucomicrobiota bacterium]